MRNSTCYCQFYYVDRSEVTNIVVNSEVTELIHILEYCDSGYNW